MMSTLTAHDVEPKAKLLRGFAEPSRLRIVEALRSGEKTVTRICEDTGLSQSNVSNHLACLLGCRLVSREQRGRYAYYSVADERIEALLTLVGEIASGVEAEAPCCPVCGSVPWQA
jgi:DNA-binding transcriptional ArsR family regulator